MITYDRTPEEVDELMDRCYDSEKIGKSNYPAMTYEEGIAATLLWLDGDKYPFDY